MDKIVKVPKVRCEVCGAAMKKNFILKHRKGCPLAGTGRTSKPKAL